MVPADRRLVIRPAPRAVALFRSLSRAAGAAVALVGGLALAGWIFDVTLLKSVLPGLVPMKPSAALAFVLAGASLRLLHVERPEPRVGRIAVACAGLAAVIGLLTLSERLAGWDLRIDRSLVREAAAGTAPPGRMAPTTALNFLLLGLALLLLHAGRAYRRAQSLSLAAGLVALLALIGYLYGVEALYRMRLYTDMALHAALAFVVLSAGVLFARPERGLMAIVTSDRVGGAVARRLLPAVLVAPIALGWVRLQGERAGLYETEFGLALVIAAAVAVLFVSIWTYATSLDRAAAERELADEALRRNEARFRGLIEGAPDAIVIADAEGRIVLVNAQTERLFGYARDELLGQPVEMLLPERLRGVHVGHRAGYRAVPRTRPMGGGPDLLARRKDGSELPVEVSLSPLESDGGLLVTSAVRDITERKRAEEEIRRRHREADEVARLARQLTETLDVAEVGRRTVETVTPVFGAERSILRLLQPDGALRAVAWEGRESSRMVVRSVLPAGVGLMQRAVAAGKFVRSPDELHEPGVVLDDELRRLLEARDDRAILAVPLSVKGRVIGTLAIRDRTGRAFSEAEAALLQTLADQAALALENARLYAGLEQRVAERTADLEAANKELEAFAYSVSHDLRAPLRAMDGFSRMLLAKHSPQLSEEARRHLLVVRKNARQMGQLIDDLLAFSRLSRQPLETRAVAPSLLVREALDDLRADWEARRVEVVVGELPECEADPKLLRQVFVNLLSNALKFTRGREAARIEVGSRREGDGHVCFVRDNGVGFDMRYADKLFGVFQRLHRAEDYEGTGVGLAIVQRIVHRHGGRVWAEAKLDEGATFSFTLVGGGTAHD
jgi:PAS domain S-box-containing protein